MTDGIKQSQVKLSDKVEALDGPCREVDLLVATLTRKAQNFDKFFGKRIAKVAKPYTASIDAALTLMPEGWKVTHLAEMGFAGGCYAVVAKVGDDFPAESDNGAKTMAIALLTAILRARGL